MGLAENNVSDNHIHQFVSENASKESNQQSFIMFRFQSHLKTRLLSISSHDTHNNSNSSVDLKHAII